MVNYSALVQKLYQMEASADEVPMFQREAELIHRREIVPEYSATEAPELSADGSTRAHAAEMPESSPDVMQVTGLGNVRIQSRKECARAQAIWIW